MLFHTWVFLAFFLVFYPVYLAVKATPLRLPWLLAASSCSTARWNPVYLLLIVWSTGVYLAVLAMARTPWKKPTAHAEHPQQSRFAGILQVRRLPGGEPQRPG